MQLFLQRCSKEKNKAALEIFTFNRAVEIGLHSPRACIAPRTTILHLQPLMPLVWVTNSTSIIVAAASAT
jgi:hypothetical protein